MKFRTIHNARLATNVAAAILLLAAGGSHADPAKFSLDIKAQKAGSALVALGERAGVQISIPSSLGANVTLNPVRGEYTLGQALDRMLSGSGLTYRLVDDDSVVVNKVEDVQDRMQKKEVEEVRQPEKAQEVKKVEEVVVTGSPLIQDPGKLTRQITTFDREEIERSGLTRLDDFLSLLPQNLNAPSNVGSGDFKNQTFGLGKNVYGGSSANLRGLGALYTLILIDGQRPTAGGQFGEIADISNIPIDRVERIEVLFDGAAAIYGADAVGGVINIITRKDYQGTNVSLTLSGSEDGGGEQLNADIGRTISWGSGNLTTSLGFQGQKAIDGSQRGIYFTPDFAKDFLVEPAADGNLVASGSGALMFVRDLNGDGDYNDAGERLAGGVQSGGYSLIGGLPNYTARDVAVMQASGWQPIYAIGLPQSGLPADIYGFDLSNFDPQNPQALLNPRGALPLQNFSLKPKDGTYNVSVSLFQELSDRLSVNVRGSYSETEKESLTSNQDRQDILGAGNWYQPLFGRSFRRAFQVDLPTQDQAINIRNYSANTGFKYELGRRWDLSGGLSWGLSRSESRTNDRLNTSSSGIYSTLQAGVVRVVGDNPTTPEVEGVAVGSTYNHPLYGPVRVSSLGISDFARFVNPNDGTQDYLVALAPGYWNPSMGFSSPEEFAAYATDQNVLTSTRNTRRSADLALQGALFAVAAGDVRGRLSARYTETETYATNNNHELPSYMFTAGTNEQPGGGGGHLFPQQ